MHAARRRFCLSAGASLCLPLPMGRAIAQSTYPDRPINLVLTVPAGGVTDVLFRKLADTARQYTNQPFVVSNRPGGGSLVAISYVRNQKPDGYTIMMIGRSVLSQYWIKSQNIGFDPVRDLTWISRINGSVFAIVVKADSPFKTWKDIVEFAKKNPNVLSYGGFASFGGMTHAPIVEAVKADGAQMQYVPFKGDGEVLQAVMSGTLHFAVMAGSFRPQVEAGNARLIALLTDRRIPQYPNVPTMMELGYPVTAEASVGIAGPKDMPPPIVAYLEDVFRKSMADPAFVEVLNATLQMPSYLGHAGFTDWAGKQLLAEKAIVDQFDLREK